LISSNLLRRLKGFGDRKSPSKNLLIASTLMERSEGYNKKADRGN